MTAFVLQDFVDLLRRTTDSGWLDPLLSDPDSSAVLLGMAQEFTRLSEAGDRACLAGAISTASGGRPGVAVVTISRTASGTGGTIPAGYGFVDARGTKLVSTDAVPVGVGALTVVIHVQSLRQTELVNTEDDAQVTIDPSATSVLDSAATTVLVAPAGSPGVVSTTFTTVVSATQILGGSGDYLSLHGKERGQLRQPHESEESYRLRVRNIPDSITPIAVSQGVRGAASQVGLEGVIIREPFEDEATPALKDRYGLTTMATYYMSAVLPPASSPRVDFVDDPFFAPFPLPAGFRLKPRETVSSREGRAYFRIETPSAISDPDGIRFFSDVGFFDDPVFGYLDVEQHPQVIASLMAIWEEANRKRAAGVQFDVLLPLSTTVVVSGHVAFAGTATAVTATAPAGKYWLMMDLVVSHDAALSGVAPNPAADSHRLLFTFSDATTFTTPVYSGIDSEPLNTSRLLALGFPFDKQVVSIQGRVTGAGARDLNLVIDARVLEISL